MTAPALTITVLDDEIRQQMLAFADTAPFTIPQAMTHLEIGRFSAQIWLDELIDAGELQRIQTPKGHSMYQRIVVDAALVNETIMPDIQRLLTDRPGLPGTIAVQLGLDLREVQETCKAMQQRHILHATPVNATFVYRSAARVTVWHDPERAGRYAAPPLGLIVAAPANLQLPEAAPEIQTMPAIMRRLLAALDLTIGRGKTQLSRQAGMSLAAGTRGSRQLMLACQLGLVQTQGNGCYCLTPLGVQWSASNRNADGSKQG